MKKVIVTLIIVAIVAGLHYLVIKSFFAPQQQNEKDKSAQNIDTKKDIDENSTSPLTQEPIKETDKQPFKFDYSNAIFGKIPELPDSSKPSTGILVDLDTGKVLWAKTPRKPVPIASMTKMMTALLAFEDEKKRDDLDMNTPIQITKTAVNIGGSQIYLDPREKFTFGELLKTVMIMSANDSAQQIAEYLGNGDVYNFVTRMNKRAQELNMPLTKFFNPHGLPGKTPSEDNYSTAEAMAIIARELLEYPEAVEWASTRLDYLPRKNLKNPEQEKEPTMIRNHNKLIGVCPGVNGMKTGFTQRAKFCVTATCERGGKRLCAVVTGFDTQKERDSFVAKLLDWGYRKIAESAFNTQTNLTINEEVIPK